MSPRLPELLSSLPPLQDRVRVQPVARAPASPLPRAGSTLASTLESTLAATAARSGGGPTDPTPPRRAPPKLMPLRAPPAVPLTAPLYPPAEPLYTYPPPPLPPDFADDRPTNPGLWAEPPPYLPPPPLETAPRRSCTSDAPLVPRRAPPVLPGHRTAPVLPTTGAPPLTARESLGNELLGIIDALDRRQAETRGWETARW